MYLTLSQEHSGIPEVRSAKPREATYSISGECERLFCDQMSTIFLGESDVARQESLEMDALQCSRPTTTTITARQPSIQRWIEVWDYASDAIYRGFITNDRNDGKATLFVFFEPDVMASGLKPGYVLQNRYIPCN